MIKPGNRILKKKCCGSPYMAADLSNGPCVNREHYWFRTEEAAKLAAAAFHNGPPQFTMDFNKLVPCGL